jgi:hypothetical protein
MSSNPQIFDRKSTNSTLSKAGASAIPKKLAVI